MKSLKGSKTEVNLLTAFAGESQARNRYTYFAKQAKKDGFEQISFIFEETANHEKEHAKRLFKFLEGGEVEISAAFPAGIIAPTVENLKAAAAGEHYEYSEMYPGFAMIAAEEGFNEIAAVFSNIAKAEKYHERRYLGLAKLLDDSTFFMRPSVVTWRCRNCGYTHEGTEPPALCPACAHPLAYYEVLLESW